MIILAIALVFTPLMQSIAYADDTVPVNQEQNTEPTENNEESAENSEAPPASDVDPLAPQNLRIAEGGLKHNSVVIEWDYRENEDDNNIQIYKEVINSSGQAVWAWQTWGNFWSRTVALVPETTYKFMIVWNGDTTLEHKSNVIEFTTPSDESEYEELPLPAPQNLRLTSISEKSATFKWTGSPGADGYDFYPNAGWAGVWDGSNTYVHTFTDAEKTPGAKNTFLVAAQDSTKKAVSEKSNAVTFKWGELAAPQGVTIASATLTTIALGWAPTPGATVYDVYQDGKLIGSTESNRYVIHDLNDGQSYDYTIVAKNDLWSSEPSTALTAVPGSQYSNITYYTSWARSDTARNLKPADLDLSNITHVNYAFADLCWKKVGSRANACQNDSIPLQDRYVHDGEMILGDIEFDPLNIEEFVPIKAANPHLKLLVSVGGWTFSKNFSNMAATEENRRIFAQSAVKFLREYNFDGLDIDWEYPVEGGDEANSYRPEDNLNFTLLMQTVREALDAAGSEDGKYYLLTIASLQADRFIPNADLANSVKYLDFVNIMTYDYSGDWSLLAHHNSPIYYDPNHPAASAKRNNVRGGALGHLNGGVPNYKLMLGVPYYGKAWAGCEEPGEYATCKSIAFGTWEAGLFDYNDLEDNYFNNSSFERYWNPYSKVAYLFNKEKGLFITFNDETSMVYSASLIKSLDIAGVMSWDITSDKNGTLTNQLAKNLPQNGVAHPEALKAPMNLKTGSVGNTTATLAWDAVEGASAYEIFIDHIYTGTTTETENTIENLITGTTQTISIFAIKEVNGSIEEVSPSSEVQITTTGLVPPSNLKLIEAGSTYLSLAWDAAPKADGYVVYSSDQPIGLTSGTTIQINDLKPQTSYNISVAAITKTGNDIAEQSSRIGLNNVKTLNIAPPANLDVTTVSPTTIKATWDAEVNATGYELYLNDQPVGRTKETSFTFTSLNQNTEYKISVVALIQEGDTIVESSGPRTAQATTALNPPANLSVTSISSDSIGITWESDAYVSGYNVFLNGNLAGYTTASNYELSSLKPYTSYNISVIAVLKDGDTIVRESEAATVTAETLLNTPAVTLGRVTSTTITLAWEKEALATGYNVYLNDKLVGYTTEANYKFESLIENTSYTVAVASVIKEGDEVLSTSSLSSLEAATTLFVSPSNLTPNRVTSDEFTIVWDKVPTATGYEVYLEDTLLGHTTEPTFKYDSAEQYKTYLIKVFAVIKDGEEVVDRSKPSVIDIITPVEAPKNLVKGQVTASSIEVKWDANPIAEGYDVYLNTELVAHTTDKTYTFTSLAQNTTYTISIKAIVKKDNEPVFASGYASIDVTTAKPFNPPTTEAPPVTESKNELDASIVKADDKWVISIQEGTAVQTIKDSKEIAFKLSVDKEAQSIVVELPQNVVAALAAKGDNAQLSIVWNNVTYIIPAHALPLGANLQISITPAAASAKEAAEKLAKDSGLKLLAQPLDFKISKYNSDGKLEEITDFGMHSLSRIFTLAAADVNTANATGVVYDPTTNTFRPVPTLFTKLTNDKVAAELKRSGNSIYTIVQSSITYKDATAAWAKDAVARAAAKLLLAGESADTFGVNSSITRAEFTSMIVKGLGILPVSGTAPFQDVAANSKYAGDIAAAKKLGLIQGKSETSFDPDSTISRQDIAVILTNVQSYLGVKTDADASKLNAFADAKDIAAYAKPAVASAVQEGIMIGKSSTTFDPKADLTRAQAAVIVIRILEAHELDKV